MKYLGIILLTICPLILVTMLFFGIGDKTMVCGMLIGWSSFVGFSVGFLLEQE